MIVFRRTRGRSRLWSAAFLLNSRYFSSSLPQVAVTWALDILHTALMSHTVYYYTVTHFGDYLALTTKPTWSFNLEILIVPIIALIVQWFFAYRAYSIDRSNWPLALTIATLAVVQLGFGIST